MAGPIRFAELFIGVDEYDSVLSTWAWDVISLSRKNEPIWQFSKLANVRPVQLAASFGKIHISNVPFDTAGFLAVRGVDLATRKSYQPIANAAPATDTMLFILRPKTVQGSMASQTTSGRNTTGPTWTVSASEALKAGLKIFGTGLESTTTAGGSRTSSSTTNTTQQQTTITTPIEVVQGLELHRTMHMPDIAMVPAANAPAFG